MLHSDTKFLLGTREDWQQGKEQPHRPSEGPCLVLHLSVGLLQGLGSLCLPLLRCGGSWYAAEQPQSMPLTLVQSFEQLHREAKAQGGAMQPSNRQQNCRGGCNLCTLSVPLPRVHRQDALY